tara:strand:- start:97 stop:204 length:108 start_codon:yes stop_codon:yes gene_type:complete
MENEENIEGVKEELLIDEDDIGELPVDIDEEGWDE